eukprot:321542-Rhodomonas_salina.1
MHTVPQRAVTGTVSVSTQPEACDPPNGFGASDPLNGFATVGENLRGRLQEVQDEMLHRRREHHDGECEELTSSRRTSETASILHRGKGTVIRRGWGKHARWWLLGACMCHMMGMAPVQALSHGIAVLDPYAELGL